MPRTCHSNSSKILCHGYIFEWSWLHNQRRGPRKNLPGFRNGEMLSKIEALRFNVHLINQQIKRLMYNLLWSKGYRTGFTREALLLQLKYFRIHEISDLLTMAFKIEPMTSLGIGRPAIKRFCQQ